MSLISPLRITGVSILLSMFLLSAGCGGSSPDTLERALQSAVADDLASMVLPLEEFGPEFSAFEADEESGFVDNAQAADDSVDPDDTADDIAAEGRISGYDLEFNDPSSAALQSGEGVYLVNTSVELFIDAGAAQANIDKALEEIQELEGEEVDGVILGRFDISSIPGVGDRALLIESSIRVGDTTFYVTTVVFNMGRLLGAATVAHVDDVDRSVRVTEIAKLLEARIRGVLLGDVSAMLAPSQ